MDMLTFADGNPLCSRIDPIERHASCSDRSTRCTAKVRLVWEEVMGGFILPCSNV